MLTKFHPRPEPTNLLLSVRLQQSGRWMCFSSPYGDWATGRMQKWQILHGPPVRVGNFAHFPPTTGGSAQPIFLDLAIEGPFAYGQ